MTADRSARAAAPREATTGRGADEPFLRVTAPLVKRVGVTRSTMMGYPCLRLDGDFFAGWDPFHQRLLAKLDANRVTELIDAGRGEAFAPSGRRFREWVAVPTERRRGWARILDDALTFAQRRASSP